MVESTRIMFVDASVTSVAADPLLESRDHCGPGLPAALGAAEPVLETGWGDARVIAGGEGLIVHCCTEVACVDVGCDLSCVVFCDEDSSGEFVQTERFGACQLDRAIHRRGPPAAGPRGGGAITPAGRDQRRGAAGPVPGPAPPRNASPQTHRQRR